MPGTSETREAPVYVGKSWISSREECHPNSITRRVREGTFPPPTLWLGPASPRWDTAEVKRFEALLAVLDDTREATRIIVLEREKRLRNLAGLPADRRVETEAS